MFDTKTETAFFPFVTFTNVDGKTFMIERQRIKHCETYHYKTDDGQDVLDHNKTFVNFTSPSHKTKGSLHAVVDMPIEVFRDTVLRPAWERDAKVTKNDS